MNNTLLLMLICLSAVSCKNYQLVTLEPADESIINNDWVYQDSLVTIDFNFYSNKGIIEYKIRNTYDKPVYIDWKRSMIITDNHNKMVYWKDQSNINTTSSSQSIQPNRWVYTDGASSGTITKPERITMLPPNTKMTVSKFTVAKERYGVEADTARIVEHEKTYPYVNEKNEKIQLFDYDRENTPASFRIYLTASLSEDFNEPLHYDFEFWVSEIMMMGARQLSGSHDNPDYFLRNKKNSPNYHPYRKKNRFYIK